MAISHLANWGPDPSIAALLREEQKSCVLRPCVSGLSCETIRPPHGHAENQHFSSQSVATLSNLEFFATGTPAHSPPIEPAVAAAGWKGERADAASITLGGVEPLTAFDTVTAVDARAVPLGWRGMLWSNAEAKSKDEHSH